MSTKPVHEIVYDQIRAIRRDGREPTEIRLGQAEWIALQQQSPLDFSGPTMTSEPQMFGIPLVKLPVEHALSVR